MHLHESLENKENAYEYLRSVNIGDVYKWYCSFLFGLQEDMNELKKVIHRLSTELEGLQTKPAEESQETRWRGRK